VRYAASVIVEKYKVARHGFFYEAYGLACFSLLPAVAGQLYPMYFADKLRET
jgi:hypothetical protein